MQTVTASLSSTLKNSKLVADYDASINTFKGEKRWVGGKKQPSVPVSSQRKILHSMYRPSRERERAWDVAIGNAGAPSGKYISCFTMLRDVMA